MTPSFPLILAKTRKGHLHEYVQMVVGPSGNKYLNQQRVAMTSNIVGQLTRLGGDRGKRCYHIIQKMARRKNLSISWEYTEYIYTTFGQLMVLNIKYYWLLLEKRTNQLTRIQFLKTVY